MKKQLYLIYSLLTVFLMVGYGCSEEDYLPSESERTHTVTLKLHIPEMEQVVMARAVNEDAIDNTIAVYFKKKDENITSHQEYTLNNHTATIQIPLNTTSILVLANYGDTAPENPYSVVITGPIMEGNLPMWGETSITTSSDNKKEVTVSLYRAVAKMTLTNAATTTFTNPEAKIFNIYDKSYLIGATEENDEIKIPNEATLLPTEKDWENNTYTIDSNPFYLYQTLCQTAQTRIVVKGTYKGTEYFYPIKMVKTDEEGYVTDDDGYVTEKNPVYLNILQNHAYELIIKTVSGPGYSDLKDALKNPPLNMLVQIIDRRVEIFNMVANGSDELGVGNTVTIEAHGDSYENEPDAVETKVFTTYTPTDDKFTQMNVSYDEGQGEGWLTVTKAENHASNNEGTAGVMYTYTLKATRNPSTTPRTATLTFKVGLLERTLQVEQKGSSVLAALSDRNVLLYSGEQAGLIDEALITDNYFASLRQEEGATPIYGTRAEDMQGVSRQGLIFNIIDTEDEFHENSVSSTLSYFIQRKAGDKITLYDGTKKYWTWEGNKEGIQEYYDGTQITQSSDQGSQYFGINSTYGGPEGYFYIWINEQALKKTTGNTLYNNELLDYYLGKKNGEMKVVITTADSIQIEIPIYVSGILHNLNGKNQIVKAGADNPEPVKGWHYYEMVKQSESTYIFDRNLGAKTNKRDAEGAYFYKKLKWKWENNQNVYDGEESIISSILADTYNGGRLDILNIGFDSSSLLFDNGCPYLNNPTYADGFKVYFPLLKYLQGHCWIEEDEEVRYELKLADGYPMGDQGGYYWRGGPPQDDKFWWNTYLFTDEGCDLTTSRITEEQGGRTELYYGMQIRPMYKIKQQ